ncbi:alpha/beta-hydrolase, partial [Clavulina sp. PMI_390]
MFSFLYWLDLKLKVAIVRFFHALIQKVQNLRSGSLPEWRLAYPRRTREYSIPSESTPDFPITIRVWDPPDAAPGQPRGVHINFHGSGYVLPDLGNDSDFCELLASKLHITVLDCDYAKAPEHPFPHAYKQVIEVIYHVLGQPDLYHRNQITFGGFSAGAGLTLCAAANESLVQENIRAIVAVYPPGDLSNPPGLPPPGPPGSTAPVLSPFVIDVFNRAYGYTRPGQPSTSLADPRISALRADWTHWRGKSLVITGEYDNLLEGGKATAEKMERDGVDVKYYMIQDVGHAWDKRCRIGTWEHDKKMQAYEYVLDFLKPIHLG